ncbi:hypothetical protein [Clostridium ganghwense]|uniref:Leucine-rich repeat domain-containing protein n=1 Tax=Clostridium ganghwense TaxID=312089 RepID=A0ABT4CKA3_9CLOT|nr:hypothetical protein [Clostridium ganghwense]MCY6369474.1 hypothetical protein [Clostridium ganghwense]
MEQKVKSNFKKEKLMYSVLLVIMIIVYLLNINIETTIYSGLILYWIVYFCHLIIFRKLHRIELIILMGIILLSAVMNKLEIDYTISIILAYYFTTLVVIYIWKDISKYKWKKILSSILIISLVTCINVYISKNRLIKDRNFERCVEEALERNWCDGGITLENLQKIRFIDIKSFRDVINLEGIEQLKNLEQIKIYNIRDKKIKNLNLISSLTKVTKISFYGSKVKDLSNIGQMNSVEELHFRNIEKWDIEEEKTYETFSMDNFPNLKQLFINKINFKNFYTIKSLKYLDKLCVSDCEIGSLDGIENFTDLKKLYLYNVNIKNINHIKKLKSLEEIFLEDVDDKTIQELKGLPNVTIR